MDTRLDQCIQGLPDAIRYLGPYIQNLRSRESIRCRTAVGMRLMPSPGAWLTARKNTEHFAVFSLSIGSDFLQKPLLLSSVFDEFCLPMLEPTLPPSGQGDVR
jgi:hypothetical protein